MASKIIDRGQKKLLDHISGDTEILGIYESVVNTQATDHEKEVDEYYNQPAHFENNYPILNIKTKF
jgi:hypothetical protein